MGSPFPIIGDLANFFIGQEAAEEQRKLTEQAMHAIAAMQNYKFDPEKLQAIYMGLPPEVKAKMVEIDPKLRDKQMASLDALQAISEGKINSQSALEREMARREAGNLAASREQAIQQQMASRGVGGSGLEFAMRNQAGQEAANRNLEAGLRSAAQAGLERLQSQNSYMAGLGNLRAQDTDLAARNADIINRFSAYNADRQMAANQYNTNMANQAALFNKQRGDRNEMARKNFEAERTKMQLNMLPSQRQDVTNYWAPRQQLTDAWMENMAKMVQMGVGGEMGGMMGNVGGQIGGNWGQMIGNQAGQQMVGSMMQQGGYNQPVPQWQQPYQQGSYNMPDFSKMSQEQFNNWMVNR